MRWPDEYREVEADRLRRRTDGRQTPRARHGFAYRPGNFGKCRRLSVNYVILVTTSANLDAAAKYLVTNLRSVLAAVREGHSQGGSQPRWLNCVRLLPDRPRLEARATCARTTV